MIVKLAPGAAGVTPYTGPASNFLDPDAFGPDWATGGGDDDD